MPAEVVNADKPPARVPVACRVLPDTKARMVAAAKAQGLKPAEWLSELIDRALDPVPFERVLSDEAKRRGTDLAGLLLELVPPTPTRPVTVTTAGPNAGNPKGPDGKALATTVTASAVTTTGVSALPHRIPTTPRARAAQPLARSTVTPLFKDGKRSK